MGRLESGGADARDLARLSGLADDVSVYGNLLFTSVEDLSGRVDCGPQGVPEPVSPDRMRGIRIFDISDLQNVANVRPAAGIEGIAYAVLYPLQGKRSS